MRTLSAGLALVLAMWIGPSDSTVYGQTAVLVVKIQDLQLTDAQEARIADIRKESRPRVEAAAKEVATLAKDEVEKIREVLTPEQKQKLEALREEREERREECLAHALANLKDLDVTDEEMTKIGEIRKEYNSRMEKSVKELAGLLTDEQKKARDEALKAGKKPSEFIAALQLTGEQKEKIATVGKELATLVREELEKIRDVLNDGQNEKIQDLRTERKERVRDRQAHRIANFQDLNLTDEQKTKLASIRQEYRSKIHEAGSKLRSTIKEEVEQIAAALKA
jgi:Spy/CpxP family protein refolding chaperone